MPDARPTLMCMPWYVQLWLCSNMYQMIPNCRLFGSEHYFHLACATSHNLPHIVPTSPSASLVYTVAKQRLEVRQTSLS